MPRDIRSYFTSSAPAKNEKPVSVLQSKKRAVISSDEDDVKIRSPVKRSKLTKKANRHHVLSDSDDDTVVPKKPNNVSKPVYVEDEKPQKVISPSEMFGKKPIQRVPAAKIPKKEAKIHADEDFEATLNQLDTSEIEEAYLSTLQKTEESHNKKDKHNSTKENHVKLKESLDIQVTKKDQKSKRKKSSDDSFDKEVHETQKKKKSSTSSNEEKSNNSKQHVSPQKLHFNKLSKNSTHISNVDIEYKKTEKKTPEKSTDLDPYEERIEKKKQSAVLYQQYLHRGGARNPGSKKIPTGAEYCLAGLSFVVTGVLDSLEREEVDELIKKYGGRILHQVTKKTDFVIVGDQAGPAKLSKADSFNIRKITEDELLEMISTRPAGNVANIKQSHAKSADNTKQKLPTPDKLKTDTKEEISSMSVQTEHETSMKQPKYNISPSPKKRKLDTQEKVESTHISSVQKIEIKQAVSPTNKTTISIGEVQALAEKYRPKSMKMILGQQGDKSCAKKLYTWLKNWHKNQNGQVKHTKPSPWAKNDDGAFFKAALLSGPPGIGKTTTAQVVCNELGFDLLEFNASDTRSKRLLKEEVSDLLSNTTMKSYFLDAKKPTAKHVLLMDEVDGMAGNEDRGGLQELIHLIKSTDIPIICICNDRNNPKMRTLSNYTFELKFQSPRLEQIRGAMLSICFKENIKMSTEDLDRLIESTNKDIRQVINHLALLVGTSGHQEQTAKKHINKDLKLGPWDVVKKVFSAEEHKNMNIHDKSDLFFHDYSITPLFVQENYLSVMPKAPRNEILERIASSAESLALGDIVEQAIRSNGAWSLLPMQACYSSVIPGTIMSGQITAQINFPAWLGRNSKRNKFDRLMQEITVHTRLATGASKEAINLDYLNYLRDLIVRPLVTNSTDGIDTAVDIMNKYHLIREDVDSLIEISLWPGQRDPMQVVESKVKAAFTRACNKNCVAVPYAITSTSKKKGIQASQDEGFEEGGEEDDVNSDEDDNVEADKMIKAKKSTKNAKSEIQNKNNDKSSKSSKRGRGRGKAK